MQRSHVSDAPQTPSCCCCRTQADTRAVLEAFVAEGDADHIPSHIRSYRMMKMVQQVE
jgi:hypothetical protein